MTRNNKFGKLLRRDRRAFGASLRKFATLAGLSPTYLSRVENGTALPSVDRIEKIARLLGADQIEYLREADQLDRYRERLEAVIVALDGHLKHNPNMQVIHVCKKLLRIAKGE